MVKNVRYKLLIKSQMDCLLQTEPDYILVCAAKDLQGGSLFLSLYNCDILVKNL